MQITVSDKIPPEDRARLSAATSSLDRPFIEVARLTASVKCEIVNDNKGGLIIQPRSKSGNCDFCGDWAGKLDAGVCEFCKTRFGL